MGNDIETGLSPAEQQDLRRIAGLLIPADPDYGVPAANDPAIFADILATLGRDRADVSDALAALATLASLDDTRAEAEARTFLASNGRAATALARVILQSYYRDDRVLRAAGQEARSPFPNGYTLEQGDWSLLDAVKTRPRLWRDDRSL